MIIITTAINLITAILIKAKMLYMLVDMNVSTTIAPAQPQTHLLCKKYLGHTAASNFYRVALGKAGTSPPRRSEDGPVVIDRILPPSLSKRFSRTRFTQYRQASNIRSLARRDNLQT